VSGSGAHAVPDLEYGIHRISGLSFDAARERIIDALKGSGFGIITEINVHETLKSKLGVEFPRYVILGACDPALAHQALTIDHRVGLLLPCNVVVQELPGGSAMLSAIRPTVLFDRLGAPVAARALAEGAEARLGDAIETAAMTQ
jgi:uncharacterized protein (DUF302 family)